LVSEFLSKKLNKEYSQLSRLFPEVEGITIEQFFILQKIEKVKEWMAYDELTLSEIAITRRCSNSSTYIICRFFIASQIRKQ